MARRPWVVSFVLLFLMGAAWAGASPIFSGPDEAAHAVKAVSVVRGQLVATSTGPNGHRWLVRVPGPYSQASEDGFSLCYFVLINHSGSCGLAFRGPATIQAVSTQFGVYPPVYYAVVGLPSLASTSGLGLYLMRLVSAAITSAFLASALVSALAWRRSRMLVFGLVVAITPVVVYVGAMVNDSGLEISAAICLWVSALVLFVDPPAVGRRRLLARAAIAGSTLVLARPLSPLWLAVVILTVLALSTRENVRSVLTRRDGWPWLATFVVSTCLALAWTAVVGIDVLGKAAPPTYTTRHVATFVLAHTGTYLRQMVGLFSFNNVPAPLFTFLVWAALLGLLIATALVAGRFRQKLVLLFLIAATLFIPVALELAEAHKYGILWQGRYALPLATGIPILAALVIGSRVPSLARWRRLLALVMAMVAAAQLGGFVWSLHRFMWGADGPWNLLHGQWEPPIPGILLIFAFAAIASAFGWWLYLLLMTDPGQPLAAREPTRASRSLLSAR